MSDIQTYYSPPLYQLSYRGPDEANSAALVYFCKQINQNQQNNLFATLQKNMMSNHSKAKISVSVCKYNLKL